MISEAKAEKKERMFEEDEVKEAVFAMGGDKAPGPNGFPIAFFQMFWEDIKEDVMNYLKEFHARGILSNTIGASFITLIAKRVGAENIKDYRPVILIDVV